MRNEPFKGHVKLSADSSLRKLMRASKRGTIPDERLVIIQQAMIGAARNPDRYLSSHARRMNRVAEQLREEQQGEWSPLGMVG